GVPRRLWFEDVRRLCRDVADPEQLCRELEQHHPWHLWGDVGTALLLVLELRGEEVFPYVFRHLGQGWQIWAGWRRRLRQLAQRRGWRVLLAALAYHGDRPAVYNAAVRDLLADERTTTQSVMTLLASLSGWPVRPLSDENATLAYRR